MVKSVTIVVCCLLSGALYSHAADEENDDTGSGTTPPSNNPYQAIADLNAFRLKPTPPPPEPEKVKTPPPKITLTGISTMLGQKKVYLKTPGTPGKPGEPAKEQYYEIAEGTMDRDIEVLEINAQLGTVRIKYEGTEIPLNFVDNGAKAIAPPPGQPGQPGAPGMIPPPGSVGAPAPSFGNPASNVRPLPTRTLRLPTPSASAAPSMAPGFARSNPTMQSPAPQNEMSEEQLTLMVELERERTKQQVAAGLLPPLPPTRVSPPGSPGTAAPGPPGLPPIPQ